MFTATLDNNGIHDKDGKLVAYRHAATGRWNAMINTPKAVREAIWSCPNGCSAADLARESNKEGAS